MNVAAITKLERLLKKFPEPWTHVEGTEVVDGKPRVFHHVYYRSEIEGRPRVKLIEHVSPDMCDLVVALKNFAPEFIEAVKAQKSRPKAVVRKKRKSAKSGGKES